MVTADDTELHLSIVMGLRRGMKSVRGLRKQVTEEEQFRIARCIAEQVFLANYRIEKGPPLTGHGTGWKFRPED
jgi:hypothetical protein